MLGLVVLLFLFSMVSAIFGFGVLADAASTIAIVLFGVFLLLFMVSLVFRALRR